MTLLKLKLISRSVIKFPWRIFIFFPFNYALYRPALTFGSSPWIYHLTAFIETFSLVIAFLLLLYTYKRLMVFSPSILFILQFFTSLIRSNRYTFLLMKVQYLCFNLSHAKYRSSSLCLSIWDVSKVCHRSWYSPDKNNNGLYKKTIQDRSRCEQLVRKRSICLTDAMIVDNFNLFFLGVSF